MSNGIAARQNEQSNIIKLAAQRQLYRDVNGIEIINVILTVIVPIGFSFLQDVIGFGKTIAGIVALIMLGLSFVFINWQKKKKILAATIQQEFDINVYSMVWDRRLFGKRKNLNGEIAAASKKIMLNEREKETLKNWYRPEVDALPLEDGIAACQKENFSWDAGLRRRYKVFLIVLLFVIIVIHVVLGIIKAEQLQEFLLRLVTISSALKWIITTLDGINEDLNRMEEIEWSVYSNEMKTLGDLVVTQRNIFENRKVATKIPDWFYRIFKNNDEDRERRTLEI